MDGTLEQARAALQVGSFDVAEAGFRAVLGDTDGIEALHCLGLTHSSAVTLLAH